MGVRHKIGDIIYTVIGGRNDHVVKVLGDGDGKTYDVIHIWGDFVGQTVNEYTIGANCKLIGNQLDLSPMPFVPKHMFKHMDRASNELL